MTTPEATLPPETPANLPGVSAQPSASGASSVWFEALPEGLKANPTLQNFKSKDVAAVAESLVNAEKLIGGSLRLPTDKDTPEERAAKMEKVFTQLGRPAKPDGYVIQQPSADTGVPWNAQQAESFKSVAHKIGLTQAQAQALVEFDVQRALAAQVDTADAYRTCLEQLEHGDGTLSGWGAATKTMLGLSRRTAATYFDPDTLRQIEATGLANNPKFVRALASMGKELMEEGLIVGGRDGMTDDGGISGMQAELESLEKDSKSAYWDARHPGHDAAVSKAESLRRALLELTPTAR